MTLETALKLIVALARMLDIPPETLAGMFNDSSGCQEYFNRLVAAQADATQNTLASLGVSQ